MAPVWLRSSSRRRSSLVTPAAERCGRTDRYDRTEVVFDVADDAYVDLERHLAAAMSRA
jgi:hypothetical protein